LTVPTAELNRYELGNKINFSNYSILQSGESFYLVDGDTLRPFASEALMRKIGYQPDEVITISSFDIQDLKIGSTINEDTLYPRGRLVRLKENNSLYYIKDNQFHPVFDEQIAKINFPSLRVEKAVAADLLYLTKGTPLLFREGTLMRVKETGNTFVIESGQKRRIPSDIAFKTLGYNTKNIIVVNQLIADTHPTGEPVYANTGLTLPKISS
jgi:hypothetical protein